MTFYKINTRRGGGISFVDLRKMEDVVAQTGERQLDIFTYILMLD